MTGRVMDAVPGEEYPNLATEAAFTTAVIEMAQRHGWRAAHFRPARTAKGWRTAVQGDVGFPDLVLVHQERERIIFAELKTARGRLRVEQAAWLQDLGWVLGGCVVVWRPVDWPNIRKVLGADPAA